MVARRRTHVDRVVRVDGFSDIEQVGSGGLGDVYRAVRSSTGTVVAIKALRSTGSLDARLRRANRELTALASLRGHPNVINLEEVVQTRDDELVLVMEFSPGGSLEDRAAAAGGMLPLNEVIVVAQHAASALVAAHEAGIVHRDIKPQNLLAGSFGQVKVCDFGIASIASSDDFSTKTNAVSYRYASPEELRGDAVVTAATDVYSLAVSLAKLLTNRYFTHETAVHLLDPVATPGTDGDRPSDAEQELRALLVRCLKHRAAARPTAAEFSAAVDELAAGLGDDRLTALERVELPTSSAPTGLTPSSTADRSRSRSTLVLWAVAIGLWLAVAVLAAIYLTGSDSADASDGRAVRPAVAVSSSLA
ncbi:putative serine/threonine protein kinase [Ilumatobacter coccineus YM16-304]|uniref:Putative serine/threonine protein kinase n=1 Tax=Ilumatobacter coccineus (strain NBRC 103263 / KCTC 29153 / YM16-304) TaxID=1313172 RepID=A0A6C7E420_ILUCY|nr:putative serine/threonine protein kinase [Ilumatobacter coccineus YM16-304]